MKPKYMETQHFKTDLLEEYFKEGCVVAFLEYLNEGVLQGRPYSSIWYDAFVYKNSITVLHTQVSDAWFENFVKRFVKDSTWIATDRYIEGDDVYNVVIYCNSKQQKLHWVLNG